MDATDSYSPMQEEATSLQSSPEVQKKRVPITPQSPLTKKELIYENADIIRAHRLHVDSFNPVTASCPDISSHIYHNISDLDSSTNSNLLKVSNHMQSTWSSNPVISSSSGVTENNLQIETSIPKRVASNNVDTSSHIYYNFTDTVGKKTASRHLPIVPIHTVAKGSPSNHAHLVDVIKNQMPHISTEVITQCLIRNGGNVEQAIKDIKLYQLTNMELEGITEADCRTALEQFNWDLSKTAEMLCSQK